MFELAERTGIITGASSGIGYAVAEVLAGAGANIITFSRTGCLKDSSLTNHENVKHIKADITDYPLIEHLVNELGSAGGIDFLINNAGITVKKRAEDISDDDFEMVHRVNVFSAFKLSKLCYPFLKKSPYVGRIISIASMAAHLGFSEVTPYCSSKSAVIGLTRGLAVEWANDNITVNCVSPGWFPSEMTKSVMDPQRKEKALGRIPLQQFGNPRDIGAMILYLLSDNARYITGQDFAVDGGALAFGY